MSLAITSRIVNEIVIVDMAGRLCALETALPTRIKELLEQGRRDFILNLAAVTYIDSSGLGQLVRIWTSIRSMGGQLILLRPTPRVLEPLHVTKLDTVFHIVEDEDEAVRRLQNTFSRGATVSYP